jgi:hypothetical protein
MKTTLTIHNTYLKSSKYLLSIHSTDSYEIFSPNYKSIQVFISESEAREIMNSNKRIRCERLSETGFSRTYQILTKFK